VGLYLGGLIFGGGAYIWNEVSVSTCGGLIHGGLIFGGGGLIFGVELIFGGLRYLNKGQSSDTIIDDYMILPMTKTA
jgi:hypothetical protein